MLQASRDDEIVALASSIFARALRLGAFVLSAVAKLLRLLSGGVDYFGIAIPKPPGQREVGLAIVTLLALVLLPKGLTNGHELNPPKRSFRPAKY